MSDIEKLFEKADFSKETSFKETLRGRLFTQSNVVPGPFGAELSDDELGFVNAAGPGGNPPPTNVEEEDPMKWIKRRDT